MICVYLVYALDGLCPIPVFGLWFASDIAGATCQGQTRNPSPGGAGLQARGIAQFDQILRILTSSSRHRNEAEQQRQISAEKRRQQQLQMQSAEQMREAQRTVLITSGPMFSEWSLIHHLHPFATSWKRRCSAGMLVG